jgi:hypothetical protein
VHERTLSRSNTLKSSAPARHLRMMRAPLPGGSPPGSRSRHNGKRVAGIERCHGWLSGESSEDRGILRADAARNKAVKLGRDQTAERVRNSESGWYWRGKPVHYDRPGDSVERTENHTEGVDASRCVTSARPVLVTEHAHSNMPLGAARMESRDLSRQRASARSRPRKRRGRLATAVTL